jgi:hypothetical protein
LFKRRFSGSGSNNRAAKKAKFKKFVNKGLHVTNRLNPVTVALRNGVLAGMKLNFLKIASTLRYTYLNEDQARQKGLVMDRYFKMKRIKDKLEKIFYGAGGKPENLKKAILTGHGNKNREVPVNGLGYTYENVDGIHEDMSLSQLLGRDMYVSENIEGMEGFNGFGELGEPVTAAAIAAASTVLTTIAALIKNVGSLVPKKNAGANNSGGDSGGGNSNSDSGGDSAGNDNSGDNSSADDGNKSNASQTTTDSSSSDKTGENSSSENEDGNSTNGSENKTAKTNLPANTKNNSPATIDTSGDEGDGENDAGSSAKGKNNTSTIKPSFWDNNKKWIKPVGIGVGSLGLLALIYQLLKPKPKAALHGAPKKTKAKPGKNILSGIKSKTKKGGDHQTKRRKSTGKKKVVTLL